MSLFDRAARPRQPLRDYQQRAVDSVLAEYAAGHRSVCLVAPTGAGKTRLGEELVHHAFTEHHNPRVVWLAHRRELLAQASGHLRASLGHLEVGVIAPGHEYSPRSPVQVATVQTLLARRGHLAGVDLVVADEAHHYVSDEWRTLATAWPDARLLGLTATPERGDGRPLGDIFARLVVAASYSELLAEGFLVGARVFAPTSQVEGGLALDPYVAYEQYAGGHRGFVFARSVDEAHELARGFTARGRRAACIEADTPGAERDEILTRFRRGELHLLTNVYTLTEGVDLPAASVCMIARNVGTTGQYLQMVGRVLRPAPGKAEAVIVDLTGATLVHGLPTADRAYSLEGKAIRGSDAASVSACLQCGACWPSGPRTCPECGWERSVTERPELRIYNEQLREVFAGASTPVEAQANEYQRLRALAASRGYSLTWVVKEHRKLFGSSPSLEDVTDAERAVQLRAFVAEGRERGRATGYAYARYSDLFGAPPSGRVRALAVAARVA